MSHKEDLATPAAPRPWTRADDYVEAMARKRTARRARKTQTRTQPEAPRMMLSTLPFVALMTFLAVLAVVIMVAAIPGSAPEPRPREVAQQQQGVAEKGWFEEAQKEFH